MARDPPCGDGCGYFFMRPLAPKGCTDASAAARDRDSVGGGVSQGDNARIPEDTTHDLHSSCRLLRWFAPRNWDCVVHQSRQAKVLKVARYFALASVVAVAGLIEADAVLGPGGLGVSLVRDQPKARSVRRAQTVSLEHPRDEERTQSSAVEVAPSRTQSTIVTEALPARSAQTQTFTDLVGLPTTEETARATRIAREKTKAERAKKRLARERARVRAIAARRLNHPYSDGHPTPRDYAYAPRQMYGPFNQTETGWGNGWSGRW